MEVNYSKTMKKILVHQDWILFIIISIAGTAWMISLFIRSTGTPVQDEIGHLIISRDAWHHVSWVLNVWGRPINTLVFMPGAIFGLAGVRLTAIIISILTAFFSILTARKLGQINLAWVALFLWGQPWYTSLSFTAITEVPFSLFLVAGIYFALIERNEIAGLCFGLLPLVRHEGIVLLGLWVIYTIIRRRILSLTLSIAPFFIYNLAYFLYYGQVAAGIFTDVQPTLLYGRGDWLHYIRPMLHTVGILIGSFSIIGLAQPIRLRWKWLVFLPFLTYLFVHMVFYRFGLFASGGYQLFLLPIAPGIAIAAGLGIERIIAYVNWPVNAKRQWISSLLVIIIALTILPGVSANRPYELFNEEQGLKSASDWLKENRTQPRVIISTHVWFFYYFGLRTTPVDSWVPKISKIQNMDVGDIIVWDAHYSDRWNVNLDHYEDPDNNWELIAEFEEGKVKVFEKTD